LEVSPAPTKVKNTENATPQVTKIKKKQEKKRKNKKMSKILKIKIYEFLRILFPQVCRVYLELQK